MKLKYILIISISLLCLFIFYSYESPLKDETFNIKSAEDKITVINYKDSSIIANWTNYEIQYKSNKGFIQFWVEFQEDGKKFDKLIFDLELRNKEAKEGIIGFELIRKKITNFQNNLGRFETLEFLLRDERTFELKLRQIKTKFTTGGSSNGISSDISTSQIKSFWHATGVNKYEYKILGKFFNSKEEALKYFAQRSLNN